MGTSILVLKWISGWHIEQYMADHITPWVEGGKTVAENCQLLCVEHNRRKSSH